MTGRIADRELATALRLGSLGGAGDAELLALFRSGLGELSEGAFRILVMRHGPMVLGACRRLLRDSHAAEDAFQATFLILAQKAGAVRVDDSLGPWLHGVCTRVARRARSRMLSEASRSRSFEAFDGAVASDSTRDDELRSVIDQEIAGLPSRDRTVIILCRIEGRPVDEVARRLRCPEGTVHSRLHRALNRLRTKLIRRGIAPVVASTVGTATLAEAEITSSLLASTSACVLTHQGSRAAVVTLATETVRRMFIMRIACVGLTFVGIGLAASGAIALAAVGDDRPKPSVSVGKVEAPVSISDEIARIKAEYEAKQLAFDKASANLKDQNDYYRFYREAAPDEVAFSRRMIEVGLRNPGEKSSRDAFLWVIDKPFMVDAGPYADEFARAAQLLLRHHGDDPIAVAVGMGLHNAPSQRRDALLHGFLASARSRESKGLARAALARYLEVKALMAKGARNFPERTKVDITDSSGNTRALRSVTISDEEQAYRLMLAECDMEFIRAQVIRIYEEVIRDYADVPQLSTRRIALSELLKQPHPTLRGRPLTAEERKEIEKLQAEKPATLGEFAKGRLDAILNLSLGKPAPEIDGGDLDGNPLKLSDYKGKVVLVVFWATWCGPCTGQIPHEQKLVERMKGKPFVLLGVNGDERRETALDFAKKEKMTWRSWFDAGSTISERYHVEGLPTTYLIDAQGNIRNKNVLGERMIQEVEKLLAEIPAKP